MAEKELNKGCDRGLVSVVVPVYNGEVFLEACLDSILAQTYREIEVIVVDDGSTDNTPAIIESFSRMDPRMQVIRIGNKGVSAARNVALDRAKGSYVTMVDADDMMHPQAVELLVGLLETTGTDVVSADYINSAMHTFDDVEELHNVKVYDKDSAIRYMLYQRRGVNPSPWCKVFRREVLDGVRFRENIRYEDLEIMPRIFERCHRGMAVCTDILYFYRYNSESFINTVSRKRLDVLKVTEIIENHMHKHNRNLLRAARDRRLSAGFNMFFLCESCGWKEDADECWRIIRRYRMATIFNRGTRMKNKVGALMSLPGRRFLKYVGRVSGELKQ